MSDEIIDDQQPEIIQPEPEPQPRNVLEFKDIHKDKFIMVCGLGASLNMLSQEMIDQYNLICIGVNDIARFRKVKYCYYQDNFRWMKTVVDKDMFEIKKYHICNYTADNIFVSNGAYWDIIWYLNREEDVVQMFPLFFDVNSTIDFCRLHDLDIDKTILDDNHIITSLSTVGAMSLAYYMGARKIGIIGMDISDKDATDNNALHPEINARTKSMEVGTEIFMYMYLNKFTDCKFYNFSPVSKVFNTSYDINKLEEYL